MKSLYGGAVVLAALAGIVGTAEAGPIYSFDRITNSQATNVESQLTVEVVDAGGGSVDFIFRNSGPLASSICDVYFDDGTLLGITQIVDSGGGVAFSQHAAPGNLPGGNAVNFQTTQGFSADSDAPAQPNGVNPGEWLRIRFALINGQGFQDTLDAIDLGLAQGGVFGALRIGIHVQGLDGGFSDSFVSGGEVIPLPSAVAMGAVGLGLVARRRRPVA